jgi:hypothetical protein
MPMIPNLSGKDCSYPLSCPFSNEYFFQSPPQMIHWEAAVYKDGELFFDVSTERLRFRKMFCWGNHTGGRHWQEFLSEPGEAYIELQAGLAPTQHHGIDMPAGSIWDWTQVFGSTSVNSLTAHDQDWLKAREYIGKEIGNILNEQELYKNEALFRGNAEITPIEMLHEGSGWGALELYRMHVENEDNIPKGLNFPISTMGEEQYPWLALLKTGSMPAKTPDDMPGAWMIQKEWQKLLISSLKEKENRNWYSLLHAGVMAYEDGSRDEACELWKESISMCESVWAYRNLAAAEKMNGNLQQAADYMHKVMNMPFALSDQAFAAEYLALLNNAKRYREAWEVFENLPPDIRSDERVVLIAGSIAVELGNFDFVERLLEREYACIREGECTLTDLWFRLQALKMPEEEVIKTCAGFPGYTRENLKPPARLDFRIFEW